MHLATAGNSLKVLRVWQSTEELIEYAYDRCAFRDLTAEEYQQFGLLLVDKADSGATPEPDVSSSSGAGVRVTLLAPLPGRRWLSGLAGRR